MSIRILTLVGSLRAGSYNRQLAEAAVKHAPDGNDVEILEGLGEVPFYNEDLDRPGDVPPVARALRSAVGRAGALLLVTPEYNGAMPAGLKNAIDWTSRPFRGGAILDKPVAVVGTSSGRYGGVWAHEDTRKTARIAGAHVLDDITLSVPHAAERFATTHPADDDEVATAMPKILATLAEAALATTKAPPPVVGRHLRRAGGGLGDPSCPRPGGQFLRYRPRVRVRRLGADFGKGTGC